MAIAANISLHPQPGGMALVHCNHCHENIGRVQVLAPPEGDKDAWDAEVRGEIRVSAVEPAGRGRAGPRSGP